MRMAFQLHVPSVHVHAPCGIAPRQLSRYLQQLFWSVRWLTQSLEIHSKQRCLKASLVHLVQCQAVSHPPIPISVGGKQVRMGGA